MTVETDGKGIPAVALKRGQTIVLPLPHEIAAYQGRKLDQPSTRITDWNLSGDTTQGFDVVTKPCPQCNRMTTQSAAICPGCAFSFKEASDTTFSLDNSNPKPVVPAEPENATTLIKSNLINNNSDATTSLLLAAGMTPKEAPISDDRGVRNVITQLSETARIVSYGNMDESGRGFRTRLEVRQQEFWLPVVRYEINDDTAWRHEFALTGNRNTTRIDLPSRAAKELAENDLTNNWEKYCECFLSGKKFYNS
jgi:hypothetical protein